MANSWNSGIENSAGSATQMLIAPSGYKIYDVCYIDSNVSKDIQKRIKQLSGEAISRVRLISKIKHIDLVKEMDKHKNNKYLYVLDSIKDLKRLGRQGDLSDYIGNKQLTLLFVNKISSDFNWNDYGMRLSRPARYGQMPIYNDIALAVYGATRNSLQQNNMFFKYNDLDTGKILKDRYEVKEHLTIPQNFNIEIEYDEEIDIKVEQTKYPEYFMYSGASNPKFDNVTMRGTNTQADETFSFSGWLLGLDVSDYKLEPRRHRWSESEFKTTKYKLHQTRTIRIGKYEDLAEDNIHIKPSDFDKYFPEGVKNKKIYITV